ncbi:MAG: ATP-binding cassette domain-containing protein [bacterium]
MIEISNLRKTFGNTVAVDGINLKVEKGEILGFLGPNGAGKTTTMRILTCYMPADSGTATLAGFDTFKDSLEIRKRLGYLPENAPLYYDMGVIDYLLFIAEIRSIPNTEKRKKIKEAIDRCGLHGQISKNIGELSKGYRQRVGLAQALIHDPDILILDEPTSGLDPNQIMEIRELIKKIGKEKTIILSSHILPEVQATCKRIVIIDKGKLVGSGTPEELSAQAKGQETVYITIRGPEAEIRAKLEKIEDVIEVAENLENGGIPGEENIYPFIIKSNKGTDIREKLFQCVVDNKWSLIELVRHKVTLEDVFTHLIEN